ncbi:MAG TPA: CocE/NonD family hydrolase [Acidobacteriota bacterium]|nr:CocE/NonD family hydrolase [Acidobacteriota bacterium]
MNKRGLLPGVAVFFLSAVLLTGAAPAYRRTEAMVAMRDGVRLHTVIYAPEAADGPLPFIINRTPYGAGGDDKGHPKLATSYKELADEGYIFVFQDIRGRYGSEGKFVMMRPPRDANVPKAFDEGTDAYDTIDWLVRNVPGNNGRVGMLGVSYDGWLTVQAVIDPHPALKAVSPQASPADMYMGDDFFHDGAFRLSYGFEYAAMMETSNVDYHFRFDMYDTFDWYLKLGPLANVDAKYLLGKIPTWNDFVAHPNYDAFWQKLAVPPHLNRVAVPTLNVAGWWDQEDFSGPLKIYAALEQHDAGRMNYFVAGPWNPGGWARDGSRLGRIAFGDDTAKYFREKVQAPWFAHYLKDKGPLEQPEALTFQTGANRWESYDEWPPRRSSRELRLYFLPGGILSFDPPRGEGDRECDGFVSDPSRPVPYRMRPVEATYDPRGSGWPAWQVQDQRFANLRPDVLSWETGPLAEDVVVTGDVSARLFASTTGTDADWVVKLIDVYPEDVPGDPAMGGYQLMIAGEVVRGRFRKGCERPEPVPAGKVEEYAIDLRQHDHRFLKGHRIMVQVQSTWFPLIDRNPQTYVGNIFLAGEADYRPATHRVFGSKPFPSHVSLMVPAR